jgi:hypothetical protein
MKTNERDRCTSPKNNYRGDLREENERPKYLNENNDCPCFKKGKSKELPDTKEYWDPE